MVYSSAPLYLDPHNWHHHQQQVQFNQHQQPPQQQQSQQPSVNVTHGYGVGGENIHHHQITVHTPTPAPLQAVGGGSSSSIRPGSMADRAKQAKIPQPESGLKCPRCDSTNTKFCYFNNYNLTQPRHFCKMCRRYWTKGGALRSVPVGGGCRRNKRSSKSGAVSKFSGNGERQIGASPDNNSTSPISSNNNNPDMNNINNSHGSMIDASLPGPGFGTRLTQFPLLASLQGLTQGQYGSLASNLGLNFGEIMNTAVQGELGFQIGASVGRSSDLWRPPHLPNFLLARFNPSQLAPHPPPSSSLYQFQIDHQSMDQVANNPDLSSRSSIISAMGQQSVRPFMVLNNSTDHKNNGTAAVKIGGVNQGGTNLLSSPFLGMPHQNSQYWVGNNNDNNNSTTWTDLSGLNSTNNL